MDYFGNNDGEFCELIQDYEEIDDVIQICVNGHWCQLTTSKQFIEWVKDTFNVQDYGRTVYELQDHREVHITKSIQYDNYEIMKAFLTVNNLKRFCKMKRNEIAIK